MARPKKSKNQKKRVQTRPENNDSDYETDDYTSEEDNDKENKLQLADLNEAEANEKWVNFCFGAQSSFLYDIAVF